MKLTIILKHHLENFKPLKMYIRKAPNQHHLERRPVHRNVATWQTSEVVGRAAINCNSYPDAIFK